MLDLIDCTLRFVGNLLEAPPNQDGAADMIADNAGLAALAAFQTGQLLGFAVKLLDLPAEAAHILDDLHVVLRYLVGDDIVRALRRRRTALLGKLSPCAAPACQPARRA